MSSLKNKKYLRMRFLILILIPLSILFSLETTTSFKGEGDHFSEAYICILGRTQSLSWNSEQPNEYLLLGERQFVLVKQWQSYWKCCKEYEYWKAWKIMKYPVNFTRGNLSDWMSTFGCPASNALIFGKRCTLKKCRVLALAKNIKRGNSLVIFENSHPWFLHSKFQTFCDESYPETVKISIYNLKRPFKMENREVIWWSILFSNEGFGICYLSLKLFCIREAVSAEDTRNVSPDFSMSNQLPVWSRII